jgi:acyl-CoA synthetase (NDP forming)
VLEEAHSRGVRSAIIYSSGYAEENAEGIKRQEDLVKFSKKTRMLICGPNCMGLADLSINAITAFATLFKDFPPVAEKGNVSVITQSGNMCIVLYATARERGVHFKYFINTGNEACLEFAEYLDYLACDSDTKVIIGYLEGLKNGPRFIAAVEKLGQLGKALILIRAGETNRGAVAARSHTASLTGDMQINRAAFKQLGIMSATDPAHAADLAYLAKFDQHLHGKRVAIVSISGAMGALLTDLLIRGDLQVPEFSLPLQAAILNQAGNIGMVSNPIDTTAALYKKDGIAKAVLETLSTSNEVDVILIYATGYLLDRLSKELIEVVKTSKKYFIAIDTGKAKSRDSLESAGIPIFFDIARATKALSTFASWCCEQKNSLRWGLQRREAAARSGSGLVVSNIQRLDEYGTKALLKNFSVPVTEDLIATSANQAIEHAERIGLPVVLKILSPDILHKTEAKGVEVNLTSYQDVATAFERIKSGTREAYPDADLRGVLVQKMEWGVCELIVGVTRDPIFGCAMTVGIGGILTEIFQDVAHRLLPIDEEIANEMLLELRGYPMLDGFRGKQPGDIQAACHAIASISRFAIELGDSFCELEINPLLVKPKGHGVVAIDALIIPQNIINTAWEAV